MRVLTVKQPWAWAIIHGDKDVENRVRSLGPYRGPIAVHVSKRVARDVIEAPPRVLTRAVGTWRLNGGAFGKFPWTEHLGHIIGVVDLVNVHHGLNTEPNRMRAVRSCFQPGKPYGPCSPWAMPDHHHLALTNPRLLTRPIPATGRLALWRPDDALLTAITEQLGEAPE